MFRLLKLLLFLNPFKLLTLGERINTFRRKLQFLGVIVAMAAALQIHIMPDWLTELVNKVTGTTEVSSGKQGVAAGSRPVPREPLAPSGVTAQPPSPSPDKFAKKEEPSRGQLFAAYADLNLSPAQVNRLPDSPPPPDGPPADVRWRRVERVLDGNTLIVDGQTVRLIGIDAPEASENDQLFRELDRIGARGQAREMLALGKMSARFLGQAEGRWCWLQYEGQTRDQLGRILAYVHLDDGTNLGEVLLYQGFAKVYLGANFRYAKRYVQLQNEAMKRRNGLWAER